ncbi:MAG TPA: SDR family oxidoreductase [Flavisolibacter sp.]|jgi:NAD(P)-dependent dehydrogenase (short-subunit alcohol dehydrogenase family)|nr:SDR family oxidoreductase [Flavisolibacter sp.]
MKKVLITGANKGIGLETARQLAQQGCHVYLGSRDFRKGEEAVAQLHQEGLTAVELVPIDISDPDSVAAAHAELDSRVQVLDVLINNAGISGGFPQPVFSMDMPKIREVFETNFFGTINVTQTFFNMLKKSEAPRIVNITSGLASLSLHNDPGWRYYKSKTAAYGPSKTALNAYTIALAYELRETPFRINAVDPGFTATDFNDYRGTNDIPTAAAFVVKYALLDEKGPSGGYFSYDNNPETGVSPW